MPNVSQAQEQSPYKYNSFKEFFDKVAEPKSEPVLKQNSANSSFCFVDMVQDHPKTIVKVQMKTSSDIIVNDSVVNYCLNQLMKTSSKARHFMTLTGSFMGMVSSDNKLLIKQEFNASASINADANGNAQSRPQKRMAIQYQKPCICINAIEKNVPLGQLLMNGAIVTNDSFTNKLKDFFEALLYAGIAFGFSHHDMHTGNILYDVDKRCLVLIDYGRSHIPGLRDTFTDFIQSENKKCKAMMQHRKNILIQQVIARKGKVDNLDSIISDTYDPDDSFNLPMTVIKANDDFKGLYILNDIAGLCKTIQSKLVSQDMTLLNLLKAYVHLEPDLRNELFTNDITMDHLTKIQKTLALGVLWYETIIKACEESGIKIDKIDDVFITRDHFCILKPSVAKQIAPKLENYYQQYAPLIYTWIEGKAPGTGGAPNGSTKTLKCVETLLNKKTNSDLNPLDLSIVNDLHIVDGLPDNTKIDYERISYIDAVLETVENHGNPYPHATPTVVLKTNALDIVNDILEKYKGKNPEVSKRLELVENKIRNTIPESPAPQGGFNSRSYKIHKERVTDRRYVLMGKKKFYLDDNRGKYKYASADKTHIVMKRKTSP